jgi:hypothetical protein
VAGRLDGDDDAGNADGGGGEGAKGAKETQDEIIAIMPGFVDLLFN